MSEIRCAIWARVSTDDQVNENQLDLLRDWAAQRGMTVVAEFVTEDSAWSRPLRGSKGREFDAKRAEMLAGSRRGQWEYVLSWALDRLSRRGAEDMLRYTRRLTETNVVLACHRDPWVEDMKDPMIRELLIAVYGTLARIKSEQTSENVKLGMARAKRQGKVVGGRKTGAGDKKPRARNTGERAGWSDERRAAAAARMRERNPMKASAA